MNPSTRLAVENCIEALIGILDALDGDTELEPEDAEPNGDEQDFSEVHWL